MAGANNGNNQSSNTLSGAQSSGADPFEEFEFRPINEGLGFHRKTKNQSSSAPASSQGMTFSTTKNTNISDSAPSGATSFQAPLPRTENRKASTMQVPTIEDDSIAKAQTAVNEILKTLNQKRQLDFAQESTRLKSELKKSKPHFFAATLDTMLITASFLMSLILMLSITKVDLFMNLTHPNTSGFVYLATIGLFLAVTFIYMVVNRAFLGATPGEWAFEQSCGRPQEMHDMAYIPRLAFRTLVVMATGFITLPILSYLFNKDMAGEISGLSLFKKPNV